MKTPTPHRLCSRASILLAFALGTAIANASAWSQTEKIPTPISPGEISDVVATSDTSQTYTLYLPSAYNAQKRWPIIYFFDPGGRGRRPLELYKEIAEKYGFIFAGSNNSRNFSSDQSKSVNVIWQDTHWRLAIDPRRTYASGFSGGARVAGAMALGCAPCQIAGVIAHGAGYPTNQAVSNDKLLYFFAVGNRDFNWPEVTAVRREREDRGLSYRVRVFAGSHQWAPSNIMEDAVEWLMLRAMQTKEVATDSAFIEHLLQQRQSEADEAEKRKDALGLLDAYRSLVSDFGSLRETGDVARKLAILKQSDALKSALKAERDQIDEQFALEREIAPKLRAYAEGSEPDANALRVEILQAMNGLSDQAAHAKSETKRLVLSRALDDMWVEGIENGQQQLESRHFDKAEACFELMNQIRNDPWPSLLLAKTHVAAGKKKQAVKDLRQSIHRGMKDANAIESDPEFQILKSDSEYQQLLSDLRTGHDH